jgi:hypothetical protein
MTNGFSARPTPPWANTSVAIVPTQSTELSVLARQIWKTRCGAAAEQRFEWLAREKRPDRSLARRQLCPQRFCARLFCIGHLASDDGLPSKTFANSVRVRCYSNGTSLAQTPASAARIAASSG